MRGWAQEQFSKEISEASPWTGIIVNTLACLPNYTYIVFLNQQKDYNKEEVGMRIT